jgi:hypothetical protein
MKNVLINEWRLAIYGPAGGRAGRVRVKIENADGRDREFVRALARLAEVWLNATRKAGR